MEAEASSVITLSDLLQVAKRKVLNKVTHVPLTHVNDDKLNAHIGNMNSQGWELMTVAVEAVGIEERFIMFWMKTE